MTTAYQGDKPYVFLSYSHRDEELALSVIEYLQEHSFNVWYDESIHSGTQWEDVIIDKITNCWMMVFLATQNSLASEWCRQELNFAKEEGKKLINVVIGSPQLPVWFIYDFTCYQFVNESKFASRDAMMDKLVKELIHHEMDTDKPKDTPKDTTKDTPTPSPTEGLEFSIVDDTARVDRYKGTDTKIIIPATITRDSKTYKVTAIGSGAFKNCKNLTFITILDGVTSIGDEAFEDCKNLTSITIPNSVMTIGAEAFSDCTNFTSITIPDSVTSIGGGAFFGCESLTSIDVDKNNTHYKSIDGNLYSRDGTILIKYAIGKTETSFIIPDHVTSIDESAFEGCENLTSITIPDSVTSIGEDAFAYCENLTSITIPNSVTSIDESAFEGCENLTSITIPDSVTSIGGGAFFGCENLTSITIPDSVTSIESYAFAGCFSLTIYCEAKSKPEGWHDYWNPNNRSVVWDVK